MTAMPHLAAIDWDHGDRMQSADLGGGGTVWFLYDSAGNRVRKIRVNQAGASTNERIYLGGYEVYREHVGTELRLERETLHIVDDSGRICLVETKTIDDADVVPLPANISRYQYGNHLGSVGMELDETGQLISYEELHPYGTTAYRAANSAVDVSQSRYRYTGQERDEETGLGHHGARYYASWLGRWTAADPIGLGDGVNRFAYARGRPTGLRDPSGTRGVLDVLTDLETAAVEGLNDIGQGIEDAYDFTGETIRDTRDLVVDEGTALATKHGGQAVGGAVNSYLRAATAPAELVAGTANVAGDMASRSFRAPKRFDEAIQHTALGIDTGNADIAFEGVGRAVEAAAEIATTVAGGALSIQGGVKKGVGLLAELSKRNPLPGAARATKVRAPSKKAEGGAPKEQSTTVATEGSATDGGADALPKLPGNASVSDGYVYRGVSAKHPELASARKGTAVPGDPNGTVSPTAHNAGGMAENSPYTSWTHDPEVALYHAGKDGLGGVVLRVETGRPPPDAGWSWEFSDDIFSELEVLLKGLRHDAQVFSP